MQSKIDNLLGRLDKVRGGGDKFNACCPAHSDKSPSMGIKITDKRILLHCFAGCYTEEITAAIGLQMSDLFFDDNKPTPIDKSAKRKLDLNDIIIDIAKNDAAKGRQLNDADAVTLRKALRREFKG